jgi:hypothetical protein
MKLTGDALDFRSIIASDAEPAGGGDGSGEARS